MKTLIASVGEHNELGRDGDLCWHIREDLRHFKHLTMGAAVVMGRNTWESLPRRPLPGRLNIVVSTKADFTPEGALKASSLPEAYELAVANDEKREIFIIGGETVYRQALLDADRLELTRIFASDPDADKFFPPFSSAEWRLDTESETMTTDSGLTFRYESYTRR